MELSHYYHAIKYLKPRQIFYRLKYKFSKIEIKPGELIRQRPSIGEWQLPIAKRQQFNLPNEFTALNQTVDISSKNIWNDQEQDLLWLYQLHYFDDLSTLTNSEYKQLMQRWIAENPAGVSPGWDPYPTSRRIVNWIKFQLNGGELSETALISLVQQARILNQRIEFHLEGNHIIANAKALIYAGLFFLGKEADTYLDHGIKLFRKYIFSQVLADGGHEELSPMYHAQVLEDLLDVLNIFATYDFRCPDAWFSLANNMLDWLASMIHPDGEVSFFNDCAFYEAANYSQLYEYAMRLRLEYTKPDFKKCTALYPSGYIRLHEDPVTFFLDTGNIGPKHLPAHAHADQLSFEMSKDQQRIIVNSGTSIYAAVPERQRQRGTAAHNTVTIKDYDSAQIWQSFRVGRRGKIINRHIEKTKQAIQIQAAHAGYRYLPGKPIHKRTWQFADHELQINDKIIGKGKYPLHLHLHFHPDVTPELQANTLKLNHAAQTIAEIEFDPALQLQLQTSSYHPEFGKSIATHKILGISPAKQANQVYWTIKW